MTTSPRKQRPARVTIKDVAAQAGVSVQTVSNYINGRYEQMSGATRGRVEKSMEKLGYYPDLRARSLRSSRTRTLGFLVLDEHRAFLADPLTALMLAGVGDVARARGFGILVQAAQPSEKSQDLLRPFRERRIDGAFLVLSGAQAIRRQHIDWLSGLGAEFVVFDEILDGPGPLGVRAADRDAGRMLTEHLLDKGHERIAFIGARVPWAVVEQRVLGYHDALAVAGIKRTPELERLEVTGYDPGSATAVVTELLALSKPPTAIVCGSDLLALAAMRIIRDAGLRVPKDVAVAGFDDFDFSSLVEPALTTVRIPAYEMGQTAATMLIDRLEGRDLVVDRVVFDVELKTRRST